MTDEEDAWDRLLFHLENQTGFWFALVVGDDARPRMRVRSRAADWCEANGVPFHLHDPQPSALGALAIDLARSTEVGLHWILADGPKGTIEAWRNAAGELLLAMNERREAYRKRLAGGVILEGREALKRLLRELAPDLFSIRAFIAEPGTTGPANEPLGVQEWRAPMLSLHDDTAVDPNRELDRADKLANRTGLGARRPRLDALLRAVKGLIQAHRFDEAERWARDALALAQSLPVRARISLLGVRLIATGQIAIAYDLLAAGQQTESALHLLRDSLLLVERIVDVAAAPDLDEDDVRSCEEVAESLQEAGDAAGAARARALAQAIKERLGKA